MMDNKTELEHLQSDAGLKKWVIERTGCTYLYDGHKGVLLDLIAKTAMIAVLQEGK